MTRRKVTLYGCTPDEAAMCTTMASRFGVAPTITENPVTLATAQLAAGGQAISINHKTRLTAEILYALRTLGVEYISTRSAGYDHIDMDYARHVGMTVENVLYSPDSVADYTIMLILMAIRDAKQTLQRVDTHDFRLGNTRGRELRDMTVGVIGTGRIGAAVIERLHGFGCNIIAYNHRPKIAANYVSLDDLVRQSDIITLHTPHNAETHHLLNQKRFSSMKDGAFVVNTGRGALIDTGALIASLESGKLSGAALDVLEGEEGIFYADHRGTPLKNEVLATLLRMPRVIITPHKAYHTDHALSDTIKHTLLNCVNYERSKQHA